VLDLIREAADDGATVLLSSHDLSKVSAVLVLADFVVVASGRIFYFYYTDH